MTEDSKGRIRSARWLGIVLVLVLGGAVAAWAGALPSGIGGWIVAIAVLGFIGLLVFARFLPDSAFGGRVGRARNKA